MKKISKVFICLLLIAVGITINTPGYAQKQPEVNPFIGLWKSENGSIVKIDGDQGVLLATPSESWKAFINKITIKNIRLKDNKWLADEWLITSEANVWVEAVWELSNNEIKRFLMVKGKTIETYFTRTSETSVPLFEGTSTGPPALISEESTKGKKLNTREKDDWRGGVGIRLSYPKISNDDFEFDDTVSLGIDLTHYVSRFFSGEFSAEYLKTSAKVSNFNIGDLTQIALLLTGRFHLPLKDGKILPYIGFGVGYYNHDFDESATGSNISVSIDNSVGLHVKLGSEFFITEHLALNLELMYAWNQADVILKITGSPVEEGKLDLNTLKSGLGVKYFF